jgi:hypothetical protein
MCNAKQQTSQKHRHPSFLLEQRCDFLCYLPPQNILLVRDQVPNSNVMPLVHRKRSEHLFTLLLLLTATSPLFSSAFTLKMGKEIRTIFDEVNELSLAVRSSC